MLRQIFLLLLVLISIPMVWKRLWLGVAIYVGLNIIRPEMLFWGGKQGSYVFKIYFALIVLGAIIKGRLGNFDLLRNRQYLLMTWLVCAVLISAALAQYQVERMGFFCTELVKGLVILAFFYMVVTEFDDFLKIQKILLGCLFFLALWGMQQSYLGNERLEGLGGTAWGDSNGVAAVFVLFVPVALAKLYTSKTRLDFWISAGIVAAMVILIFLTKSRGGLLGLVVSVFAFGFYSRGMRKVLIAASLLLILGLPFAGKAYIDRMKTIQYAAETENLEDSAKSRLILWEAGLMVFSDNPLFGTGFLTYPEAKMRYEDRFSDLGDEFRQWVFRRTDKKVSHNTYIQTLSDCGLFGAIPFFLLIMGAISSGRSARRLLTRFPGKSIQLHWLSGLSAGLSGYAVCIFFIDGLLVSLLFFQLAFTEILMKLVSRSDDVAHQDLSVDSRSTESGH